MSAPRTPSASRTRAAAAAAVAGLVLSGCVPASQVTPSPSTSATASAASLDQLTVAAAGPMRGYSRARFPHWRDTGSNCDVRDDVLKRDGESVRLSGCNVTSGKWLSPYDGKTFSSPSDVDIDHMVPLANAWRSGAASWTDEQRGDFANDLTRPQLIAVSASSNRAKGDQDPSQWKPPNRDYWCKYAQDWIAVKSYWRLSVTAAEKATLADMMRTC